MDQQRSPKYAKLDSEAGFDDSETLLSQSDGEPVIVRKHGKTFSRCLQATFLLIAFAFGGLVGAWVQHYYFVTNGDAFCAKKTTLYSPLSKAVDIHYELQSFNGSLLKENIYRQEASPEVDAAWDKLGVGYRSVVIPEDQAEKSGIKLDQVKINPKYGGGYPAQIEGFHQLHCLNMVRQGLFYNFEYYRKLGKGAFVNDDNILRKHITHCVDILRQQLMCTVDTSMFGQVWVDRKEPFAYVDFNAKDHVCKNFEDVRVWAEAHQLPENVPDDFLAGPDGLDAIYAELP